MENSAQIMNSFQSMGRLINNNAGNVNFEQMSSNMQNFERTMDELLINTKMIEEMMGQNGPVADTQADDMLQVLKGQLALEENNQINEAALIHQREIEYANNLKKL